ncbi:MAG: fumarylacetoacetate hydrolase family protein [Peptococcaceae bacterium]|nr:fumarylacetoacetate hydrolase family protein [Peptococcaceae bacterium]
MKLLNFLLNGNVHVGLKLPEGVLDLTAAGYTQDLASSIRDFAAAKKEIEATAADAKQPLLDEKNLHYLAPGTDTTKILCVGLNYKLHIEEAHKNITAAEYPKDPILFSKFNNALNAHNGTVTLSVNATNYDYEAELVAVMGKGGMDIPKEKAAEYIFGYTCGNDISARDAQNKTAQWLIGKSFPGFAPVGPWIVTADELDPCKLAIECRRGGQLVQSSNTELMIFDVYTIVSYASQYIRLEPGDLIFTGTPNGVIVGMTPDKQNWLKPGDEVTVSIEKIGDLTTRFV